MSNNKKIIKQISKEERSLVKEVFLNIVISKNLLGGCMGLGAGQAWSVVAS